jgi:hypothetical protein
MHLSNERRTFAFVERLPSQPSHQHKEQATGHDKSSEEHGAGPSVETQNMVIGSHAREHAISLTIVLKAILSRKFGVDCSARATAAHKAAVRWDPPASKSVFHPRCYISATGPAPGEPFGPACHGVCTPTPNPGPTVR